MKPVKEAPVAKILEIADRLYPFAEAESWDNCGLQLGDPSRMVRRIAFALDPTPTTVKFAADNSCELLVTHHPLMLEPLRSIRADRLAGRTILDAARFGVDIVSIHTNLDAAPGGLNDYLVFRLGLVNPVTPHPARCARIAALPHAMSASDFAGKTAMDLEINQVRIVGDQDKLVQKIFCASGSGMGYLEHARLHDVDLILTGDVRYHAAREALEMGVCVIDAGHYGLEKAAPGLLCSRFSDELDLFGLQIACIECDIEMEPFEPYSCPPGRMIN
jgi:dinuclear metal center YbgI/SA1388 family protein